jgi:hypothetical protein
LGAVYLGKWDCQHALLRLDFGACPRQLSAAYSFWVCVLYGVNYELCGLLYAVIHIAREIMKTRTSDNL